MDRFLDDITLELYQSIENRLLNEENHSDFKLHIRPEILNLYAALDPSGVDYLKIQDLDNEDFLLAVYLCMNRRPPSEADFTIWQENAKKWPKERFQRVLIETVGRSGEINIKGSWLNNYSLYKAYDRGALKRSGGRKQSILFAPTHRLYMMCPMKIRVILKRIFFLLRR